MVNLPNVCQNLIHFLVVIKTYVEEDRIVVLFVFIRRSIY